MRIFLILFSFIFSMGYAQSVNEQLSKIYDSKYYQASYVIPYLDSALRVPGGAQTGILVRSEHNFPGGYVNFKIYYDNNILRPFLGAKIYSGCRFAFTNTALNTNYWVSNAISNLGGCYTSNNGTTVYTVTTATNTNTNRFNADMNCLNTVKSNNLLFSTKGSTNNAAVGRGSSLAIVWGASNCGSPQMINLGTLVDSYSIMPSNNFVTPSYYLPPATYMLLILTNQRIVHDGTTRRDVTNCLTNIKVVIEVTKR